MNTIDERIADAIKQQTSIPLIPEQKTKEYIDPIFSQEKPFTWGTEKIDDSFELMDRGKYFLLAGEQGSGKTEYAFFLAKRNVEKGHKVLFITLEMSTDEILVRTALKRAKITKSEWDRRHSEPITGIKLDTYLEEKKALGENENLILEGDGVENNGLQYISELASKHNPDFIIVDNMDLIQHEAGTKMEKHEAISTHFIKYTKAANLSVLMLHHMNKDGGTKVKSITGTQKIVDAPNIVVTCERNKPVDGEPQNEKDKAEFKLYLHKGRMWGDLNMQFLYFYNGTFHDTPPLEYDPFPNTITN